MSCSSGNYEGQHTGSILTATDSACLIVDQRGLNLLISDHRITFLLINRIISQNISSRPDQRVETSMLYNEIKALYHDTFLINPELNDQICIPLIDILLNKMVDSDYLKRNMNSNDLRTFYTLTETGKSTLSLLDF